ncbi:uncharacterized protein ACBT44_002164 isoform 2-T4 [Syngnathus typhle]
MCCRGPACKFPKRDHVQSVNRDIQQQILQLLTADVITPPVREPHMSTSAWGKHATARYAEEIEGKELLSSNGECWWTSPGTRHQCAMMKSSGTAAVGFLVVTVLWRLVIGDVWCRWKTPCLLEANFPIGDVMFIRWEQWSPSKLQVHSFYYEKDQLQEQDQHFRGRTSLFKENIPKGNASLQLTDVLVADEGTYMCYVGTDTGPWRSFIKLNVVAAVTSIRFHPDDEDQLICSSGGIFPQPELRWSTEPALPDAFRNSSQVQQETQTQLYNINGSLALAGDAHPDLEYICDVSTSNSSRRITWRKTTIDVSIAETNIECAPVSHPSSLEWTFNHSNVIANRSAGHKLHIVSDWKEHVKGVSEAGTLNLYHLSAKQSGAYTCTLSNNTQTRVQDILLTVTEDVRSKVLGISLGVLGAILFLGLCCRCGCSLRAYVRL